jgi:hypothetical protein
MVVIHSEVITPNSSLPLEVHCDALLHVSVSVTFQNIFLLSGLRKD